jgi:DNA-binding CsgD family transcriptional regulator
VVAATSTAWDWIDRLGLLKPNAAEPLPGFIYSIATRVALSRARGAEPPPSAQARLQAADGRWTVVRVAPLIGAAGGYVITLEAARSDDLAPLLMQAWSLTAREREVARLVIDGLSSEDIAQALFISVHTVRDHVKAIFGKTGVGRRHDLVAALAGNAHPAPPAEGAVQQVCRWSANHDPPEGPRPSLRDDSPRWDPHRFGSPAPRSLGGIVRGACP